MDQLNPNVRDELLRLQNLLLPATLPTVGCTEVAAAYVAHNHEFMLGGDFYDLIDRPDNQVAAIIGDVVGHGVEQISVMGQLRSAANALARSVAQPHELLSVLDACATDLAGAEFATVGVVMLDGTMTARISLAGHPPPLHIDRDGTVRFIDAGRRPPLTVPNETAVTATFDYEVDDLIVLFTDGLVERRNRSFDEGLRGLAELVVEHRDEPCADIVRTIIERQAADAEDDVAVLLLRPRNHRAPDHLLRPVAETTVVAV